MSKSDTMFIERDRRCAAVKLLLSTDSNYDNRAIASTLKMQIWIATNNRDVPSVMKIKFPAMVMVFGAVSREGHITPPHIIEVGLKVNTKVYLDVLKSVVIPWCNQVVGGRSWVWQQDLAPAHKSKEAFVPFTHWLPSNMTFHNTKASLIAAIRRVFTELPQALVEKACCQFRIRIEVVIEAESGYIE